MFTDNRIKFTVIDRDYPHMLITVIKGQKLHCWMEKGDNHLQSRMVNPMDIVGGKETLIKIGAWDSLNNDIKHLIEPEDISTPEPIEHIEEIIKPEPMVVATSTLPLVKRGRGRPRKIV